MCWGASGYEIIDDDLGYVGGTIDDSSHINSGGVLKLAALKPFSSEGFCSSFLPSSYARFHSIEPYHINPTLATQQGFPDMFIPVPTSFNDLD